MRRSFLLLQLLWLMTAHGLAAEALRVSPEVSPCLNLRTEPDTASEVLTCVEPNVAVDVIATRGEWRQVRVDDGSVGWVAARFLEPEPVTETAEPSVPLRTPEDDAPAQEFVDLEPFPVGTSTAELATNRSSLRQRLLLTGELEASRAMPIVVPRTSTWSVAIRWLIDDGSTVEAGDKLVEFDNSSLVSELEDLRVRVVDAADRVAQTRLETQGAEADLELAVETARIAYEKARLGASLPPELLSGREYQERQLALRRAEIEYFKARETLASRSAASEAEIGIQMIALETAQARITQAEREIQLLELVAPSSGIAVVESHPWEDRKMAVGDTVWPGMTILTLPDLDSLAVAADLVDVDDHKLSVGMPGICGLDAYPEATVACRVESITPVARATSSESLRRAFGVRLALAEIDTEIMRPGMSVGVEIERARHDDVLLAPRAAIDFSDTRPRVLLESGGAVEVELGPCSAHECVIESGLDGVAELGHRAQESGE